jgi:hypothetical protein
MPAPMLGPVSIGGPRAPNGPPAMRFGMPRACAAYTLIGIARDSTGAPLGNATIDLFYSTGDKQRYASTIADASGAYTFISGDNVSTFFVVAYLDGGTPVAGTTKNDLKFT